MAAHGHPPPAYRRHKRLVHLVGRASVGRPDFFDALHVEHLPDWWPEVLPYLALPPVWAFVIAPGYEDVWFDEDYIVE